MLVGAFSKRPTPGTVKLPKGSLTAHILTLVPPQLVLSVSAACLLAVAAQQPEDNRGTGQRGCQPPGCFGFEHTFDPIGRKLSKIGSIFQFKGNKFNKKLNLIQSKLQFEINKIRSIQSFLESKLRFK